MGHTQADTEVQERMKRKALFNKHLQTAQESGAHAGGEDKDI